MSTVSSPKPWLSAYNAAKRIGLSVHKIHNLALAGRIRTKADPGQNVKYWAEDVDKLGRELNRREPTPA